MSSKKIFTHVRSRVPNTNRFDLSHDLKTSLNFGKLTPIFLEECIPGDRWKIKSHSMLRFAPLVAPVMASVNVFTHFWFVPYRIMWDNWEKFITGGTSGEEEPSFPRLEVQISTDGDNELLDYFGVVADRASMTQEINAMPFKAYQMIWYHWYRDENLQDMLDDSSYFTDSLYDGVQDIDATSTFLEIRNRAWEHDYFTSALPFAQRGEQVMLPEPDFSVDTTISYDFDSTTGFSVIRNPDGTLASDDFGEYLGVTPTGNFGQGYNIDGTLDFTNALNLDNSNKLLADSQVTMGDSARVSITELRTAIKLQEYLEKNARGGARYVEWLKNIFGVKSSDARLQLPEYIGGGKQSVVISEVLQTSETTEGSPQANMAGHGVSTGQSKRTNYFCEEHGMIVGIMSVMPRSSYATGLKRIFRKFDKFDYYLPQFAHIGEQELYNFEIFNSNHDGENYDTFGYMPRYIEYRFSQSRVTGEMRRELDFWNMARKFSERPYLNGAFIEMNEREVSRVFADENDDYDKLYAHIFFQVSADRRIARYGTPTI